MSLGCYFSFSFSFFFFFFSVGCIVRIERELLKVLDQNGQERSVKPQEATAQKRTQAGTALDSQSNEIRPDSIVKVTDGPFKSREGKVLHVHRSNIFVYSREYMEHNGVFVCRSRHVLVAGARPLDASAAPVSSFSPAVPSSPHIHGGGMRGGSSMRGGMRGGGGGSGRGGFRGGAERKSELIHQTVRIISGPHKGYVGIVKDATDTIARVELHTNCKTISVEPSRLKPINDQRGTYPSGGFEGTKTPVYGSQTPKSERKRKKKEEEEERKK